MKTRHHLADVVAVVTDDGEPAITGVCVQGLPCGCRVVGNGTIRYPLTVKLCAMHERIDMPKRVMTVTQSIDPEDSFRVRLQMQERGETYNPNIHAVCYYTVESVKNFTGVSVGARVSKELLDAFIAQGIDVTIR